MALCWDLLHRGWSTERADAAVAAFQTLATRPGELTPADQLLYSNVQMFRSQYLEAFEVVEAALCETANPDYHSGPSDSADPGNVTIAVAGSSSN